MNYLKVTLNIRIDKNTKEALKEIAKANNRSMTQQIEHWIITNRKGGKNEKDT